MGKYGNLAKSAAPDLSKTKFSFVKGKYTGGEFFIRDGQKLSIGRDISSDVAIVDSKVSRHHASIVSRAGRIFIEDHGSTNGTLVNKEKIAPETQVELFSGSEVTIGDSVIFMGGEGAVNEISNPGVTNPAVTSSTVVKEKTDEEKNVTASLKNVANEYNDDDDELLSLDSPVQEVQSESKISIAKVALKKGGPATTSKTVPDSSLGASKGSLSAIDPCDLLKVLCQASSTGYLISQITAPFKEKIELTIGVTGIVSAESITNRNFSQEKVVSRFLLAFDGEYEFKVDEAPKRENANSFLEDVFMEILTQKNTLFKYRKIVKTDQLRFQIPIMGKLSSLTKPELETLQFMVNTKEVLEYLNLFPENDDFILLAEILKFIDMGILFGDNNDSSSTEDSVPEDVFEM
ncbi:MAG TPA: FHA domain-containing protein [bacterium]|mgnify:CR=1 FL=1|nr:FHA domain-containing protein [bacterium]HPS29500.1 FHA domain-containing protein [bacterium]